MRSLATCQACIVACVIAWGASAGPPSGTDPGLQLVIEAPDPGATFGAEMVFVSGRALRMPELGGTDSLRPFEVIIAVDVSASTRAPTGTDVDGDGHVGRMPFSRLFPFVPRILSLASDDPGDSILASEMQAIRTLLDQLDPGTTRVGVVAFSGDIYSDSADAFTAVPLSSSYAAVTDALDRLLERGPAGMTNISHAITVSTDELAGAPPPGEDGVEPPRKVVLLMTDGQPTLPVSNAPSENGRRALEAARRAAERAVRFDTFGIGQEATRDPHVIDQIAQLTGGQYTPVEHPRDLVAAFRGIRLAQIAELRISNLSTGEPAQFTHLGTDGSFSGIVELNEGENDLEVQATSTDGLTVARKIRVHLVSGARAQQLTSRLHERRLRVLESRRSELNDRIREMLRREMEAARQRQQQRSLDRDLQIDPEPLEDDR